jgi:hypothetical protein
MKKSYTSKKREGYVEGFSVNSYFCLSNLENYSRVSIVLNI